MVCGVTNISRGEHWRAPKPIQPALRLWFLWSQQHSVHEACPRTTQNQSETSRERWWVLVVPRPGSVLTHFWHLHLQILRKPLYAAKRNVQVHMHPLSHALTYNIPPPLFFFWIFKLREHLLVNCSCDVMTILFWLEHHYGNFVKAFCKLSIKSFIVSRTHWSKVVKRLYVITQDFVKIWWVI